MRTIRIYQPGDYCAGEKVALSPEASHHVGKVLRMQIDEPLTLFCGDNRELNAIITEISKKNVTVQTTDEQIIDRESPCAIHLAQSIAKGEKMEWIIQKATELGVAHIYPIWTQHSAVKLNKDYLEKKMKQWQAIAISACEQSGRNVIPRIHEPCALQSFLEYPVPQTRYMLDPYATQTLKSQIKPISALTFLIGPEGGFHPEEIKQAIIAQYQPLSLGPRILRTETAAIAVLSILQALAGDL